MRLFHITALALLLALPALGQDEKRDDPPKPKTDRELREEARDAWDYLLKKYDANKDGKVDRKEYDRGADAWKRLDKDGDGVLTEKDLASRGRSRGARKELKAPEAGKLAPDFKLELLPPPSDEDEPETTEKKKPTFVQLSKFKGKRPVALIFGSYT